MMATENFMSSFPDASQAAFRKPAPLRKFRTSLALLPEESTKPALKLNKTQLAPIPEFKASRATASPPGPFLASKPALLKQKTHVGTVIPNWRSKKAVVQPSNAAEICRNKSPNHEKNAWSVSTDNSDFSSLRSNHSGSSWASSLTNDSRGASSVVEHDSLVGGVKHMSSLKDLSEHEYVNPEDIMVDFSDQASMVIGEGGQGKVFKAFLNGEKVAVKLSASSFLLEEYALISKLRHKRVIRPIAWSLARTGPADDGNFDASGVTYMAVYEYCLHGDLGSYMEKHPEKLDDRVWINTTFDHILEALEHVHGKKFLHTDVKPDNVLVAEDETVRLADFGMCQRFSDRMIAQGTPSYLAPEMVANWHCTSKEYKRYTGAADIFSFGILMTNVLTGKYPFQRITARLRRGVALTPIEMDAIFTPPTNRFREIEQLDSKFAVVAKMCMRVDADERPSAEFLRQVLRTTSK